MSAAIKCLVLTGCTAVGKSQLAMRIAARRPSEIISADSVAVYRGLNIGSAKPSRVWRRQVQHHLIDVADPAQSLTHPYTAGDFARHARQVIHDVAERGHLPIVCGGSGMYLSFLIHGHEQYDGAGQRPDTFTTDLVQHGLDLHPTWTEAIDWIAKHLSIDPEPLRRVQHGNRRRLERTAYRLGRAGPAATSVAGSAANDIDFRVVTLVRPRLALYRDIDLRCEYMVQRGLLDEVVGLHGAGQLPAGSPPALAVGYRQALAYLDQFQGQFELAGFRCFLDDFQTASRQLARRQLTWFRQDPVYRFMQVEDGGDPVQSDDANNQDVLDRVLFQLDLDRTAYDALSTDDESCHIQNQLRQLSDEDRDQQRRYIPQPVIFKYGMSESVIIKLMAQDPALIDAV